MCALGRHQLEDDIPAPRNRARAPRSRRARKAQREVQLKLHQALAADIHALPAGQAAAQEQFALQFEAMPPGADQIADGPPVGWKPPYWVTES